MSPQRAVCSPPRRTSNTKLFVRNLPLNTKRDELRGHILEHVSDVESGFIVSVSAVTSRKYGKLNCYGSVTVSCPAEIVISKLNGSTMKGRKIKVALFESSKKVDSSAQPQLEDKSVLGTHTERMCHSSTSQTHLQEGQEVCVVAMATPPLTEKVPEDVLMDHFTELNEYPTEVKCFKRHNRPYFKIRLKFPTQDSATTAIIRMNGSILLDKHKLKLQFEHTEQRSNSLAASSSLQYKPAHHRSKVLSLSHESTSLQQHSEASYTAQEAETLSFSVKVTNIKPQISREILAAHFSQVGDVLECKIYPHKDRYGIITFRCKEHAENAVYSLNGSKVEFRSMECIIGVSLINCESESVASIPVEQSSSVHTLTGDKKRKSEKFHTKPGNKELSSFIDEDISQENNGELQHEQQERDPPNASIDKSNVTSSRKTTKKTSKPCKSKPTKVLFQSTCMVNKSTFQEYIEHHTHSFRGLEYEIVDFHTLHGHDQEGVEIEVLFSSQNQAKAVLKQLVHHDPNLSGHIAGRHPLASGSDQRKAIDDFKKSIASKRDYYTMKYQAKIAELEEKLECINATLPKKVPLAQFEAVEPERRAIRQNKTECEHQYQEFTGFCDKLLEKLKLLEVQASKTSMDVISQSRKRFGRECNRYQIALPMYAYREYITTTILENRVTVLIGETGSGKSTQLVQYLFEAGLGESGIIACTQPRKVAAISLAKHVSTEMGVTLGHELGYKTGLRGKYSEQTKVLYMTDHTLLNECIADPSFSKYSCLIVDEAHERSLSTDLLLAFIKQCLPLRPDLKVVITSATIDPDLFVHYFGGDCPVMKIPGRTYPVDVIYCNEWGSPSESPIDRDYVKDAVEQTCMLHESEPAGDFVVFLTSAVEIERACQLTSIKLGNSAIVLPLHGKLQPEDQQKVFKEYKLRKIVFSTNVAETSVTIPGVKCIVDTGLAKELCFDPKKNMNSLEVRLISKSSAEQRKGRAGRTSAGKCYRLYSEEVYARMPSKSLPEILRVTLASTVLKLYEFGVTDVIGFKFVEEPDGATLEAAVESLEFLGAIRDGHLTELGKKMAALPIDPHHSKVLFDGIEKGIGLEAAIAVTISTLAGGIFFRAGSDEVKSESDMKTIEFCHPAGDQITYLHTYCQWASHKADEQTKWCVANFINAKSMRMVKETLTELKDILKQQFHIVLPSHYDLKKAEDVLPKLYFDSFIRHLSVYLGHERVGYLNERYPVHQFVIFPGCPLRQLNEVPRLLVYEKTLVTTQHFLLQVLPVKEEWIQESLELGKLQQHPFSSSLFHHLKVLPLTICNIGPHVLSSLRKQQKELGLNEQLEVKPVFEYLQDRGEVKVFLQECYHPIVHEVLQLQVDRIKNELWHEVFECGVSENNDSVRIVTGRGGSVRYVLMPDQYRTVMIKARVKDCSLVWPEQLLEILSNYGMIEKYDYKIFKSEQKLFVTFFCPEDAMKAIELKLPENVTIEPRITRAQGSQQFSLQLEWIRRKRERYAFIEFNNEENLIIAEQNLCSVLRPRLFCSSVQAIKYQMSREGNCQLYATNVAITLTDQEIKEYILSQLPMLNEGDFEVKLGYQKSFETPKLKVDMLKQRLHDMIQEFVGKDHYSLSMNHPQNQYRTFRARVQFNNPADGQRVFEGLQDADIDGKMLTIKPLLSSVVFYSKAQYNTIAGPLNEAIKKIEDIHTSVKFNFETATRSGVRVRISSDDVNTFIAAKRLLEEAIGPVSVDCSQNPILREFIRSRGCRQILEKVKSKTFTFIFTDYQTAQIKIYGAKSGMQTAKKQVLESLSVLEDGVQCYDLSLKVGRPPGLMKHLITQFGFGLRELESRDGVAFVHLNPSRQVVTIFATEDAFGDISVLVNECSKTLESRNLSVMQQNNQDQIECCVCFTVIKSAGDIFRLEYCGHAYCRDCISLQVAPNALSFPVECAADQCSKPFVWKDFHNLSQRIGLQISSFIAASLRSYAAANPDIVRYCPTPDCPIVYTVSSDSGKRFFCTQCGVSTCTKCHFTYHEGITCEQYKDSKEKSKELDAWMLKNTKYRKRCPKCNIPIEKNKGCNHIHCRQCSADICWVCLKYFDTPNECYDHLHDDHKGLWDPQ